MFFLLTGGRMFLNLSFSKNISLYLKAAFLMAFLMMFFPDGIFAQATSSGLTQFQGSLESSVSKIFGYVKVTVTIGLLLYTIWPFYHALVGEGDKSRYWWQIIGIAVFLIILNIFPIFFNAIFSTNITITD